MTVYILIRRYSDNSGIYVCGVTASKEVAYAFCCGDFHHSGKDQHGFNDPCPVQDRFEAALTAADAILQKAEGI